MLKHKFLVIFETFEERVDKKRFLIANVKRGVSTHFKIFL